MNWNETANLEVCKLLKNLVARDGIEPPTPAFSGLLSAITTRVAHLGRWERTPCQHL